MSLAGSISRCKLRSSSLIFLSSPSLLTHSLHSTPFSTLFTASVTEVDSPYATFSPPLTITLTRALRGAFLGNFPLSLRH